MIGQLAGNATGAAMANMDEQQALALIKSVTDEYGKINVPKLQQLVLQQNKDTQLSNVKDDPTYRTQQNQADAQLDDVINSGGLTLSDKAALNAIRNRSARNEAAGRNAIAGDMAARGTLDSGSQLAMQLQGNQQSANSLAQADESAAAQAQARAFAAIKERAALAGQGLDRSYQQQSAAARAQDAINAGNTAIANTALQYNNTLPQQDFNNQLKLADAKAQPIYNLAGAHGAMAKDKQQQGNATGNIIANGINSASKNGGSNNTGNTLSYDDGANKNLPNSNTVDNSFANANSNTFNDYPTGSNDSALSSQSTRPTGDGSENYEIDPATGKIRRKQGQGQNF